MRARAVARSTATRREVEQSIARFEKRLDEANDALKTLGGNLGTGARGSYKEVTSALGALRRSAAKTNKQALKDFDKLRGALTQASASRSSRTTRASGTASSRTKKATSTASSRTRKATSTASSRTKTASSGSRASGSRSTSSRSTAGRSSSSRSSSSRAKKS